MHIHSSKSKPIWIYEGPHSTQTDLCMGGIYYTWRACNWKIAVKKINRRTEISVKKLIRIKVTTFSWACVCCDEDMKGWEETWLGVLSKRIAPGTVIVIFNNQTNHQVWKYHYCIFFRIFGLPRIIGNSLVDATIS